MGDYRLQTPGLSLPFEVDDDATTTVGRAPLLLVFEAIVLLILISNQRYNKSDSAERMRGRRRT